MCYSFTDSTHLLRQNFRFLGEIESDILYAWVAYGALEGTAGGYNYLAPLLEVRCLDEVPENGTPCNAIGACKKMRPHSRCLLRGILAFTLSETAINLGINYTPEASAAVAFKKD